MFYLILMPLFGALIAFLSLALVWFIVLNKLNPARVQLSLVLGPYLKWDGQLEPLLESLEIEKDLAILVDQHLDALVEALRRQIPMSSLLLTGTMAARMKMQARDEILKMAPALKEKIIQELMSKIDLKKWVADKIDAIYPRLFELVIKDTRDVRWRLAAIAAALGFVLGLIEAGISLL